eukprot:6314814-Ditylum_brightwellii.AAC.1
MAVYILSVCHFKTAEEKTQTHLLADAFFFAIKSYKHSKSGRKEERRTITIRLRDKREKERGKTVTIQKKGHPAQPCYILVIYSARNGTIEQITSAEIRSLICTAVQVYGEDKLGFKAEEVGMNLNKSGAAIAMYLADVPVYTITLIGHWSSDAFLATSENKRKNS